MGIAKWGLLSALLWWAMSPAALAQSDRRMQEARVYGVPAGCKVDCPLLYLWTGPFGREVARQLAECRSRGYRCTVAI